MPNDKDNAPVEPDRTLPLARTSQGLSGSKDGRGIGDLVDEDTVDGWVREYIGGRSDGMGLSIAFRFGVRAEGRYAGQSFIEAEPGLRSEWSSERGRLPWETVRDAVWAGFDRARDRRI
jgi:hypothetical protein